MFLKFHIASEMDTTSGGSILLDGGQSMTPAKLKVEVGLEK
jgi:hypothetical protein